MKNEKLKIGDSLTVTLRGPDGEIKHQETRAYAGRPKPKTAPQSKDTKSC